MKKHILSFAVFITAISLQAQSLMVSKDLGNSWEQTGLLPIDAKVNFVMSFEGEVLTGTENQGVYLGGKNISSLLPGKKVNGLLVQGNTIYTSIYKKGLFKTVNRGFSWEKISGEEVRGLYFVNNTLLVGSDLGISTYSDGKWKKVFHECQVVSIYGSGSKIVAGASRGLLLSEDYGKSWSWIHKKGAVHNLNISKDVIYSLNISGELWTSSDWGRNWQAIDYPTMKGSYLYDIIDVEGRKLMSNDSGVFISEGKIEEWKVVHLTEKLAYYDMFYSKGQIYAGTRPK